MISLTTSFRHCPIEAVIFDLDGTLLDSATQIAAAINILLGEQGLKTFDAGEIAHFVGWGSHKLIELAFASRGSILSLEQVIIQEEHYLANYALIAKRNAVFFPGAIDLIRSLVKRKLRLGICTNKAEGITRAILQKAELLHMFEAIVGADSGFGLKPSPAPLHAARRRLGATGPRTVFVGDSVIDNETAVAADVPFVLVRHHGYPTPPIAFEPEYRLNDLFELMAIIDKRNVAAAP